MGKLRRQREQAERAAHPQPGSRTSASPRARPAWSSRASTTAWSSSRAAARPSRATRSSALSRAATACHPPARLRQRAYAGGPRPLAARRWDEDLVVADRSNRFSTGLQISTRSRIGVLSDVTAVLAACKINVHEISARDLNDGFGVINAMVDVAGVHQLEQSDRPAAVDQGRGGCDTYSRHQLTYRGNPIPPIYKIRFRRNRILIPSGRRPRRLGRGIKSPAKLDFL